MEQAKLTDIQAELALVENELQELSYASMRVDVNSKPVPTYVLINREPYYLECPFPYLGSKNETTSPGNIKMHNRYAGGFETYLSILSDGGSYFEYYRHGRKVSPIIDRDSKKVIFPLGIAASLSGIAINFLTPETAVHATDDRQREGKWTIISPDTPISNSTIMDWPQGFNNSVITTMKIVYGNDYEVWMVQSFEDNLPLKGLMVWFYIKDWNVAPIIDDQKLTLAFPSLPGSA